MYCELDCKHKCRNICTKFDPVGEILAKTNPKYSNVLNKDKQYWLKSQQCIIAECDK